MPELSMRDVSRAGHELGRGRITDLPDRLSVRELLTARVRADVAAYNSDPGPVFRGLVQPADAMRHSDGHRMSRPRPLDGEAMVAAVEEALTAGLLSLRVGETALTDPDAEVEPGGHDEVTAVLERSIVAREA